MSNRKIRASKPSAPAKSQKVAKAQTAPQATAKPALAAPAASSPVTIVQAADASQALLLKVGTLFSQNVGNITLALSAYLDYYKANPKAERQSGQVFAGGTAIATIVNGKAYDMKGERITPVAPTAPKQETQETFLRVDGLPPVGCHDITDAVSKYQELQVAAGGKLLEGQVYTNGVAIAVIKRNGNAFDMSGAVLQVAPKAKALTEAKPAAPKQEDLEAAVAVTIPSKFIAAALAVAAKKDEARPYLCAVYIHQVGNDVRIVAGDGARMIITTTPTDKVLPWGQAGVLLDRADLDRIAKYMGKGEDVSYEISFGTNHPTVTVKEPGGMGQFTMVPMDHAYVNYQKVLDTIKVFNGGERKPVEATAMNPAYLKSAGAIAAVLESEGVFSFMDESNGPCAFTFANVPGAVLVVAPMRMEGAALDAGTVKLLGPDAMRGSIAALKAHATRAKKELENTKDKAKREKLQAQVASFTKRAEELAQIVSVKLEAPKAAVKAEEVAAAK